MRLLNAIFKLFLDILNAKKLKKDNKNAYKKAYKQTGNEIETSKKQGRTINGSKRFKKNLKKQKIKNQENFERRSKLIDRM